MRRRGSLAEWPGLDATITKTGSVGKPQRAKTRRATARRAVPRVRIFRGRRVGRA
jgi:hypothetical protein